MRTSNSGALSPDDSHDAPALRAFALILEKLGRRDHTEKELVTALLRKEVPRAAVHAAIVKARREGLVNDLRLAARLARNAAGAGLRGPRRVVAKLRQKGVAAETAKAATREAYEPSEEQEALLIGLAGRLFQRARAADPRSKRLKVLRSLVGRGFELSDAKRALRSAETALMIENRRDDASE